MLWTEKYRPRKLSEVVNQERAKSALLSFIKNFKKGKAALIFGPSGSGKTSIAYALASELQMEVIELNASHFRNKEQIQKIIGGAIGQKSLFAKSKMIIIDELEGITGQEDRGGIQEIIKLIETTSYPIILICDDPYEEKLRPLLKKAERIQLKELETKDIMKILVRIVNSEKLEISKEALEELAKKSKGNARNAIIDLQVLATSEKEITKESVEELDQREREEKIFDALNKIFTTKNVKNVFENLDLDLDEIFLWLDENLPLVYEKEELERAYEILSIADLYKSRITRQQHWRFLAYIYELLSAGIAYAKITNKKPKQYKKPFRILKIWMENQKQARKKEIAEKLAKKTHTSKKEAIKNVYFFKIASKNKDFLEKFAKELNLNNEQIEWLKN